MAYSKSLCAQDGMSLPAEVWGIILRDKALDGCRGWVRQVCRLFRDLVDDRRTDLIHVASSIERFEMAVASGLDVDCYDLDVYAARTGCLDIVKLLVGRIDYVYNVERLLNTAALHGHLNIIRWFQDRGQLQATSVEHMSFNAASAGHLHVLKHLHTRTILATVLPTCVYDMFPNYIGYSDVFSIDAMQDAIGYKHYHVVKWFVDIVGERAWSIDGDYNPFAALVRHGDLEMCEWALSTGANPRNLTTGHANGNIKTLDWILSFGDQWCENTCVSAAARGDIDFLEYAKKMMKTRVKIEWIPNELTMMAGACFGMVVFDWLLKHKGVCTEHAVRPAIMHGHLDVVIRLVPFMSDLEDVCELALQHGHLHVAKWGFETKRGCIHRAGKTAARKGNIAAVKWAMRNGAERRDLINSAIESGNIKLMEMFVKHGFIVFDEFSCGNAVISGSLAMFKWCHDRGATIREKDAIDAAKHRHCDILEYILENKGDDHYRELANLRSKHKRVSGMLKRYRLSIGYGW